MRPVDLPPIPAKRYFSIGEVSELCQVKPYVLRYWEQEFAQLKPMKRRGNRRYYQHHEVLLVRRIRALLYEQGMTINGARAQITRSPATGASGPEFSQLHGNKPYAAQHLDDDPPRAVGLVAPEEMSIEELRKELVMIGGLLAG